jgi:hypothetical protein
VNYESHSQSFEYAAALIVGLYINLSDSRSKEDGRTSMFLICSFSRIEKRTDHIHCDKYGYEEKKTQHVDPTTRSF